MAPGRKYSVARLRSETEGKHTCDLTTFLRLDWEGELRSQDTHTTVPTLTQTPLRRRRNAPLQLEGLVVEGELVENGQGLPGPSHAWAWLSVPEATQQLQSMPA